MVLHVVMCILCKCVLGKCTPSHLKVTLHEHRSGVDLGFQKGSTNKDIYLHIIWLRKNDNLLAHSAWKMGITKLIKKLNINDRTR